MTRNHIATSIYLKHLFSTILATFALLIGAQLVQASPRSIPPLALESGQAATLLWDGNWLITGGDNSRARALLYGAGRAPQLLSSLMVGRALHSATVMPSGEVLIHGGLDANGKLVANDEFFDPSSGRFTSLPTLPLTPRAGHSATLLSDGRLLIVGGVNQKGQALSDFEIWNPANNTIEHFAATLSVARYQHSAILLPNGNVLIASGKSSKGEVLANAELFDVSTKRFADTQLSAQAAFAGNLTPEVAASRPANGASGVELDVQPALRMNHPLQGKTLTSDTLTLMGPFGTIRARIVAAEGGLLAFITPEQPLKPSTEYRILLNAPLDNKGYPLTGSPIRFVTGKVDAGATTNSGVRANVSLANFLSGVTKNARTIDGPASAKALVTQSAQITTGYPPLVFPKPLLAPVGVNAISGLVMTLDGKPLANVQLSTDGKKGSVQARTDSRGRFLLAGVNNGRLEVFVDARPASRGHKTYGTFVVGVDVQAGKTNALPYVMWMPELDLSTEVTLDSPTKREVVLTTPKIPGLEVHIPTGTVIRDFAGNAVKKLSLTMIPVDRPPFPLPNSFAVPVYFTAQPGGAHLYKADGSLQLARIIYPNYNNRVSGSSVDFWNYDPEEDGWHVYGSGTVTSNRKQIVPASGVGIYEFTGAMINTGNTPPGDGPPPGGCDKAGDPVDCATGLFLIDEVDFSLGGVTPLNVQRTYRPNDTLSRPFGIGMTHVYEVFLWSANQYQEADLILPDGGRVHFVRTSPGIGYSDAVFTSTSSPTQYYKARIVWNTINGWDLTLKDGTVYNFGDEKPMQSMRDRYGNRITLTRTPAISGNITRVDASNGRYLEFTYDTANHITQVKDNIGRTLSYTYDLLGRMQTFTNAEGKQTKYTWETCPAGPVTDVCTRIVSVTDARGNVKVANIFDANGRVTKQTYADGGINLFAYTLNVSGKITQTDVTNERGIVNRRQFNADRYVNQRTIALGSAVQQIIDITRAAPGNFVTDSTDALGRVTHMTYDAMGNVASVTRLYGTPNAVTTSYAYEPKFQQIASITDPLNHNTTFSYDTGGKLTGIADALGHTTQFVTNGAGQPTLITDPLGHGTQLEYDNGDLVKVTDALGRVTKRYTDRAGRLISVTDPLGNRQTYNYDAMDRMTSTADALGNTVRYSYDANGNLLTFTDPRANVTQYTYDGMNRRLTRKDPLLKTASYDYDLKGNIVRITDRKGQVSGFTYDALDRKATAGFGATTGTPTNFTSTVTYTFDAGNRLRGVVDSVAGTIDRNYDDLNRLTQEISPQGTVNYTFDAASRRATMQVLGVASNVVYTFDNADRLINVTQGAQQVTIAYDNADRRTSLSVPNGIGLTYGYNNANQLASLTYTRNGSALGDLTYTYDASGRRSSVDGSLARVNLPAALASATFNANNQRATLGTTTLTYDANGNLLGDGSAFYSWDARNQLSAVGGAVSATFLYDIFGRRVQKTVAGTTTKFVYDGLNVVQEQSATAVIANILTGLRVDENFARTEGATTKSFIGDALGSTLALADSAGIQTNWTYEPYGKATFTGIAQANPALYTGRELDGTGLYYYRSRYYHPGLSRFVSEDPIEYVAGPNLYAYVNGDPISAKDPLGQCGPLCAIAEGLYAGYKAYSTGQDILDTLQKLLDPCVSDLDKALAVGGTIANSVGPGGSGAKMGPLPKPPRGPGKVPLSARDPKRKWTPNERAAQRDAQGGECANGCGTKIDNSNSEGHHIDRHADGGQTNDANHAEVCRDCHQELHAPDE